MTKRVLLIFPAGPAVNVCRAIANKVLKKVNSGHFARPLSSSGARPISHYMCIASMTQQEYDLLRAGAPADGVPGMNNATFDHYKNHPLTAKTGDQHVFECIDINADGRTVKQILADKNLQRVSKSRTDFV